ncbi:MAG TPA: T9SS type A sorting domain-containing protein [Flavisolibacter sp.]|nr:T9SS type A sorting domain-containing protein [Flavisolibacter sp.]
MKKIFTLILLSVYLVTNAQVDGTLDQNFGNNNDGTSTNAVGSGFALKIKNQKIIVLPNKKILQVFSVDKGTGAFSDFGLARYDSSGIIDPTFNSGGIVITDLGGDDYATSIAVQPDGIIMVAGYSVNTSTAAGSFALARYDSLGNLDVNFNAGGSKPGTILRQIGQDDRAYSVALQPVTQKIIVAGFTTPNIVAGTPTQIAVAKFDTTGNLDASFNAGGTPGKVLTATNAKANEAYSVALQPNGKIVVAGNRISASGTFKEFLVVRYTSTGTLDATFNGSGIVSTKINASGDDYANSVALQTNGMIVAAGASNNGSTNRFAVARYDSTGVLDAGFNDATNSPVPGVVVTTIGVNDVAYIVALQADNRILVAGSTQSPVNNTNDFGVVRYKFNGTIDSTFNDPTSNTDPPAYEPAPGMLGINFQIGTTNYNDIPYSIATQANKLVIGGLSTNSLALARIYNSSTIIDVLPVQLYSFTATIKNSEVILNWQTAAEKNSSYFEIQRSADGINFSHVGKVLARGNGIGDQNYSFTDVKPASPISFYRLRIADKDLKQTFSKILSVRFDAAVMPLLVFPNPVKDALNIQLNNTAGPLVISVFDASGRLVKVLNMESPAGTITISMDVSSLQKGIYFIKVKDDFVKLIKE